MLWKDKFRSGFLVFALLATVCVEARSFTLTILHTNDTHARFEPTVIRRKPYGGLARQATLIKKFRASEPNPIVLNAGDVFQGTMYFNVYEGLADVAYMNHVRFDAMALGNHEFDRGPAVLSNFIKLAQFPILCSNIDVSQEGTLNGLVKPYTIVEVGKEKVGVIGAVTPDLPEISSSGPTVKMLDLVQSVQVAADKLAAQGINKIILVTHIGFQLDKQIAAQLRHIDVIVGGHSHSPLGTPEIDGWPKQLDAYPVEAKSIDNKKMLIVQAWEWGKVLGKLRVIFNTVGDIESYLGNAPVVVDESVPEDPYVKSLVAALQKPILESSRKPIGETKTSLLSKKKDNWLGNDPVGELISDAMLAYTKKMGAVAAFINWGGVRASLEPGVITFGQALSVQPFGNTLVLIDLKGSDLVAILEQGVAGAPERSGAMLIPSEGTSYSIDVNRAVNNRISAVTVGGEALDPNKTYRVCFNNFTAGGGDGHNYLRDFKGPRVDSGFTDIDAFSSYIQANTPLDRAAPQRLKVYGISVPPPAIEWLLNIGRAS